MIYSHVFAAIVGASIAAIGAYKVQDWRYGEQIASMKQAASEATTNAVKDAMAKMEVDQKRKDDALIESNKRAQKNAVAAANASTAVNGLRDELSTARADLSKATIEAVRNYAATCSSILGTMAESGAGIAAKADGHSSDTVMLEAAWPN